MKVKAQCMVDCGVTRHENSDGYLKIREEEISNSVSVEIKKRK